MVLTCELNRGFDSLHAALPLFAGVSCCIDCLVLTLVLTRGSIRAVAAFIQGPIKWIISPRLTPARGALPRGAQAALGSPGPPGGGGPATGRSDKSRRVPETKKYSK